MSLSQLRLLQDSQYFRPLHPLEKFASPQPDKKMSLSSKRFQVNHRPHKRSQNHMLSQYKEQIQCHSRDNQEFKRYGNNEFNYLIKRTKQLIDSGKKKRINLNSDQKTELRASTDRNKPISFRSKEFHQSNSNYWRFFEAIAKNQHQDSINGFYTNEGSYFSRVIYYTPNGKYIKQGEAQQQNGNQSRTENFSHSLADKKSRSRSYIQSRGHCTSRGTNYAKEPSKLNIIRPSTTDVNYRARRKNSQINQSCEMLEPW